MEKEPIMSQFNKDIKERSFDFALNTIRTCKYLKEKHREFIITNQLFRSATSVGANMREAKNAESKADFIHKLAICQKECDESVYWMELLIEYLDEEKEILQPLRQEAEELLKIIKTISIRTKENVKRSKNYKC